MSKTLNETVKTAMHGVESVRVGAEHGLVNTLSVLVKAAGAVAGVVTILRTLDRDDGLAWFGFGRRRHPFRPLIVLGAGIVTGAVAGVMLHQWQAPTFAATFWEAPRSERRQGRPQRRLPTGGSRASRPLTAHPWARPSRRQPQSRLRWATSARAEPRSLTSMKVSGPAATVRRNDVSFRRGPDRHATKGSLNPSQTGHALPTWRTHAVYHSHGVVGSGPWRRWMGLFPVRICGLVALRSDLDGAVRLLVHRQSPPLK